MGAIAWGSMTMDAFRLGVYPLVGTTTHGSGAGTPEHIVFDEHEE